MHQILKILSSTNDYIQWLKLLVGFFFIRKTEEAQTLLE